MRWSGGTRSGSTSGSVVPAGSHHDTMTGDKQRQINQQGHMTFNGRELEDHFPVKLEALKDAGKTKW
jgi:hypothetical protein